ncbi:MAG: inositol monophosphatase family protein [Opitutales bacterium]
MSEPPTRTQKDEFAGFASSLCREAASEIVPHYRSDVAIEKKRDATPVTVADRNAEKRIREIIRKHYPNHGIIGEEFGNENSDAEFVWVLDPIDGTKSFISGVPLFATLIALLHNGRPLIGAIHQPILEQLVLGDGETTTLNGTPVQGRPARPLAEASLVTTDPIQEQLRQNDARWDDLPPQAALYRSWGDAGGYILLCSGFVDIMCDPVLEIWDYAALLPCLAGAGIKATGWSGGDVLEERSVIAAKPALHEEVMNILYPANTPTNTSRHP